MSSPQVQVQNPAGAKTLVIGCKIPTGFILEVGKFGEERYRSVRINGANSALVAGGYGLTTIDADVWTEWLKKHGTKEMVAKGFVFAHTNEASAASHAKERAELKTGLERLDPNKTPAGIEVDRDHMKQATRDVQAAGFTS